MFDGDPLDLVREGLARLRAEDRSAWSGAARSQHLVQLRAVQERIDAEVVRSTADWDAVGAWGEDSAVGPRSWVAARTPMSESAAHRLLSSARLIRGNPATATALADDEIGAAHVHTLAAAAHHRADAYAADEPTLLAGARKVEVRDFARFARRWRELADDERSQRDAEFAFERRGLQISLTTGGSVISGFFDPEASAIVTQVIDDFQPPDPSGTGERPAR